MFDDWEWMSDRSDGQHKNFYQFLKKWKGQSLVVFEIGAGNSVPTIRNMMEQLVLDNKDAKMIRINPDKGVSSARYMGDRYVDVTLSALEGIEKIKTELSK